MLDLQVNCATVQVNQAAVHISYGTKRYLWVSGVHYRNNGIHEMGILDTYRNVWCSTRTFHYRYRSFHFNIVNCTSQNRHCTLQTLRFTVLQPYNCMTINIRLVLQYSCCTFGTINVKRQATKISVQYTSITLFLYVKRRVQKILTELHIYNL